MKQRRPARSKHQIKCVKLLIPFRNIYPSEIFESCQNRNVYYNSTQSMYTIVQLFVQTSINLFDLAQSRRLSGDDIAYWECWQELKLVLYPQLFMLQELNRVFSVRDMVEGHACHVDHKIPLTVLVADNKQLKTASKMYN